MLRCLTLIVATHKETTQMSNYYESASVEDMVGHTFAKVCESENAHELMFEDTDGSTWKLFHSQDCCEYVSLEDVVGDLDDLVGTPIVSASEETSEGRGDDNLTQWTFYHFRTIKGTVTLRWHGSSNGYYSVSVDCARTAAQSSSENN